MDDIRDELRRLRTKNGTYVRDKCTDEENKQFKDMGGSLPEGVYQFRVVDTQELTGRFYRVRPAGLTDTEAGEYLMHRQMEILEQQQKSINSIKGMVTFFVVLTCLNLIGSLILAVNVMSAFS